MTAFIHMIRNHPALNTRNLKTPEDLAQLARATSLVLSEGCKLCEVLSDHADCPPEFREPLSDVFKLLDDALVCDGLHSIIYTNGLGL